MKKLLTSLTLLTAIFLLVSCPEPDAPVPMPEPEIEGFNGTWKNTTLDDYLDYTFTFSGTVLTFVIKHKTGSNHETKTGTYRALSGNRFEFSVPQYYVYGSSINFLTDKTFEYTWSLSDDKQTLTLVGPETVNFIDNQTFILLKQQ